MPANINITTSLWREHISEGLHKFKDISYQVLEPKTLKTSCVVPKKSQIRVKPCQCELKQT